MSYGPEHAPLEQKQVELAWEEARTLNPKPKMLIFAAFLFDPEVAVKGFDYYNPLTGAIESGDTNKIVVWLLDPDYDGRSLFPRQVFFPMAGEKDGWARLAKNLKAEIDEESNVPA